MNFLDYAKNGEYSKFEEEVKTILDDKIKNHKANVDYKSALQDVRRVKDGYAQLGK